MRNRELKHLLAMTARLIPHKRRRLLDHLRGDLALHEALALIESRPPESICKANRAIIYPQGISLAAILVRLAALVKQILTEYFSKADTYRIFLKRGQWFTEPKPPPGEIDAAPTPLADKLLGLQTMQPRDYNGNR